MPTYESICLKCNTQYVYVKPIEQREETPVCCGQQTDKRIITPIFGSVDTPAAK